jgi:hypothetical protein
MKKDRSGETVPRNEAAADRRQFLRSAIRVGGAAALLLTPASRKLLASSLTLSSGDLEAAQRARQIQGAALDSHALEAEPQQPAGGFREGGSAQCDQCSGTCSGTCLGSCANGCVGACVGTCENSCSGSCANTCTGTCTGMCAGTCSAVCAGGNN